MIVVCLLYFADLPMHAVFCTQYVDWYRASAHLAILTDLST